MKKAKSEKKQDIMDGIEVTRIDPLDLPADIVWQISGLYHITQKDFVVYVRDKENKMYVNNTVPEKDIAEFIEVVTFPGHYVSDDDEGKGEFLSYVYEHYGSAAFMALINAYEWRKAREQERNAKEKAKKAVPLIKKMIKRATIDERLLYEVWSIGYDLKEKTPENITNYGTEYVYCLGYLSGKGVIKDDYIPDADKSIVDYYSRLFELLEHIDMEEAPKIYGYLKEMYFTEKSEA